MFYLKMAEQYHWPTIMCTADGDCFKDVNVSNAMAKRRMLELTAWERIGVTQSHWTVLSFGAEAWALKIRDERKITSTAMWL